MARYGRSGAEGTTPYPLPPIGSAEILAASDEASEFGCPANYDDPDAYHGKTPLMDPSVRVSTDWRV